MKQCFNEIKKGTVVEENDCISWNLGNMMIQFFEDPEEYYVSYLVNYKPLFRKKRFYPVTHEHLMKDEVESFIKENDDPNKRLRIKKWWRFPVFGDDIKLVDKSENKEGYYYSEL